MARYDYSKMNLTAAIKLEEVEKEIEVFQNELSKCIDEYEYLVKKLENFSEILDNIGINNRNVEIKFNETIPL